MTSPEPFSQPANQPQQQPQQQPYIPTQPPAAPGAVPPGYQQPQYGYQAQGQTLDTTNTFAILTLVFAFVAPIVGIILGHMSLKQIREQHQGGEQMAKIGLILSYVFTALAVVFIALYIFIIFVAIAAGAANSSDYSL